VSNKASCPVLPIPNIGVNTRGLLFHHNTQPLTIILTLVSLFKIHLDFWVSKSSPLT